MRYYLLIGSNIGHSLSYIEKAKFLISLSLGNIIEESSIYRTAPWGESNQDHFLNQALSVDSDYLPADLMSKIEHIESLLGKKKQTKYGARTIDIDILLCDDKHIESKNLTVPHPRLHERAFTLIPLAEIASNVLHPVMNKSIIDLLKSCEDPLSVERL